MMSKGINDSLSTVIDIKFSKDIRHVSFNGLQ